jgi:hypothetical protein
MRKVVRGAPGRYVSSDMTDKLSGLRTTGLRTTGVVVFTELEPPMSASDRPVGYMLGPSALARKQQVIPPWRKRLRLSMAWLLGR